MNKFLRKSLGVVKKSIILIVLLVASANMQTSAQITVTTANSSVCTNYASTGGAPNWTALGNMTIREGANSDLGGVNGSWTLTMVLAAPAGWQFNPAVSPSVTFTPNKNVSSATVSGITSTSLAITISGSKQNKADKITIAGLQVQPTTTSAATGMVVPSSVTGIATGLSTSTIFATLNPSAPTAGAAGITVSSSPSGAICAGSSVTFTAAVTNGGTTPAYQWKLNGSNISGATSSTYSSSSLANGNTIVCSVISYSCISTPTATSAAQTMTVNPLPAAIGGSATVCTGSAVTYTNTVSGGTWSSSNTDVATVDLTSGAVAGINAGTATITYATGSGCTATKVITVNAAPAGITGAGSVCVSATTTLSSTTSGAWSSSATGVATVNSSTGVVTGVAAGTAIISLNASNGCNTTSIVTVNAIPANITGTAVCADLTTTLTNSVSGGTWSSSNTNASVDPAAGVVTGVAAGTATVTYTLGGGCYKTAVVTVNTMPAAISGASTVCTSGTTSLSDVTGGGTWASSATGVATINSGTGLVSGVAQGTTTISYSLSTGCRVTTIMSVTTAPAAIGGSTSVCSGLTTTLTNSSLFGTWSSSTTAAATVSAAGVVTGGTSGTSTISYATGCGTAATKVVTVSNSPITGTLKVCTGFTTSLADAATGGTWSSSSTSIATVGSASGVVTGVANGTATISYINGGCTATAVVTVNVAPMPISGSTSVCQGSTATLSDAVQYGSWASSDGSIASVGSSTGVVTGLAAGTTVITYSTGCGTSSSTTFTVNVLPVAITGIPAMCAGSTQTLSSSGGGTWSSSNTSVATIGPSTGVVTGVAAGMSNITYALATGCSVTGVVTVNAAPSANSGSASVCQGGTTTLTNGTGGGSWISSNTSIATVGSVSGTVAGVAAGTASLSYILSTGCAAVTVVTVNALPSAITGAGAVCPGTSATLSSSTAGGTWSSSITGVASVNASTGEVMGVSAGTSNISYTLSTGCKVGKQITVNPSPSAISGAGTACMGATTTLTSAGGGTWVSGNTSVATIGSSNGVVTGVSAGTAVVTYTLATGCTATKIVIINTVPSAGVISGASSVCALNAAILTSTVGGGTWTVSDSSIVDMDPVTGEAFGLAAGAVTVYYGVTNACGTTYVTSSFVVDSTPTVNAMTGTAVMCQGATTTLSNNIAGGVWSSTNTSVATVSAAGIVTGVAAGTATISYTISNSCGSVAATKVVTVSALPGTISGTASICVGATTTLTNAGGGAWTSSNGNATVGTVSGVVAGITAGTSVITYTLPAGCATTKVVTINAQPAAISGIGTVCEGAATTLSDATAGGAWSSSNGTVATVTTGGVVSGVVAGNAIITYALSTGCMVAQAVTVNAQPASITGTTAMCEGATTTLNNSVAGGAWSSSNTNATIGAASGVATGVTAGTSTITYILATGCATTKVVTINAQPAAINGITTVCEGLTTTLGNMVVGGTWSSSNSAFATVSATGVVSGITAGVTTVTYTLSTGCATAATITVNTAAAAITGMAEVCMGATTTLANVTVGGTWSSNYTSVAVVDPATGTVSGMAAGTATVTYAIPAGCPATRTVTVDVMPAAVTGATTVCTGSTTTLGNATAGGAWSSSAAGVATVDAAGVVSGAGAGIATITYAMPTGCQVVYPITVNAAPMPILGDNLLCLGVTTLYYADSTPGGTWSTGDASVATIAATGGLTGVAAGNTTVSYTTATGCFVTTPVTVVAAVAAITGPATVCVGSTTTLYNPMPGGVWSSKIPAWAPADPATGVVTGISAGAIPVTYSFGNSCYAVRAVTVNPLPGTIGGVPAVCAGLSTSLSNPTTGGAWSSSDTSIATTSIKSATWAYVSGMVPGTVTIAYTLPTGCFRTNDVTVNPVAPISGPSAICMGDVTTLTNAVAGGTWSSSMAGSASVGLTSGVMAGLAGGSATIMYYLPTGCKSTLAVTVNRTSPITGATTLCGGSTITLANSISGGVWSSSDSSTAATAGTIGVITGVTAGTAVITYTTMTGCNKMVTVTVNNTPDFIAGPAAVCAGSTITMGNTFAGGSWSLSNTSVASVGSATGIVAGIAQNHTVTLSYTMPSGCSATKVISINQVPSAITGAATICQGSATTFTNSIAGGSWSSSDETVATVSSTGSVTGISAGAAVITYALGTGCMQTKAVTVNPISPIAGDATVCVGSTMTVSDAAAGGTWASSVAARGSITADGVITGIAAGTAVITYSMPSGCRVTSVVTVNALPAISGTAVACVGLTTTLAGSVTGGSWSSSNTAIADVDAASGVVTGNAAGSAIITYSLPTGCFATKVATINAFPSAIGGSSVVCVGSAVALDNAVAGGTWSSATTTIATVSSTGVVMGVAAGTTNISYTTGTGCMVGKLVTVNPIAVISGTASVCLGMTTTLSCGSTGGTWSSSSAIAPISASGVVTGASAGTAVVTYTIPSGCTRTVVVSVNPAATAITGAGTLCAGFTSTLAGNVGGGTWSSSNAAVATIVSNTGVVSGVASGTAVVSYTSGLNCKIATTITVNASATISGTLKVCAGSTTALSSSTTGGVWSSSTPAMATVDATSGVVTGVAAGTSMITYSPATGCGRTAVVTVNPLPAAITGPLNSCVGATSIVSNSTSGGVSYTSSNASIASVGATSGIVTGVSAGTALITYTVNTGCISTAVYTVNALPSAIEGSTTTVVGASTTLSSATTGGTWQSGNVGRASVGLSTGVVTGITAGTFNVTYTLATGCKTSATITVNATASRSAETATATTSSAVFEIEVYPNPTSGTFTVKSQNGGVLSMYGIDGKEASRYSVSEGATMIQIPQSLGAGIYMCRFTDSNNNTTIFRLEYQP